MQDENTVYDYNDKAIHELRTAKGLTLREFGAVLGMAPQQVKILESGPSVPNLSTVLRIVNAFRVKPENFFTLKRQSN